MVKVIPNQVVCKNCMVRLEYESSDVINEIIKYPNLVFQPDDSVLLGGSCVIDGYVEKVEKYIECPNCKTKVWL